MAESCLSHVVFRKVFGKVLRHRLVAKLGSSGVPARLCCLIEDFVQRRLLAVRVADLYSTWHEVGRGVAQGFLLGPLLFLMLIDDFPQVVKSPCLVYSDDLKHWLPSRTR